MAMGISKRRTPGRPARAAPEREVAGAAAQEVEAGRSGVDVQAGHAEGVVVIPECGRPLVVRILERRRAGLPVDAVLRLELRP